MKKIVFGVGTGRCGTVSLCELLNNQIGANFTHEDKQELPWKFSREIIDRKLQDISSREGKYVGDVAFYYLPYVEHILEKYPEAKFLYLERSKDEVVRSYLRKTWRRNHWVNHRGIIWRKDPKWDKCFPNFNKFRKRAAIRSYWEYYHEESQRLQKRYKNNFRVMNMRYALNTEDGIIELLRFLQFGDSDIVIRKRIKENTL